MSFQKLTLSLCISTILLSLLFGERNIYAGEIIITISPSESDIYVRRPSDMKEQLIGKTQKDTPFEMKMENIVEKYGENGMIVVIARKNGFIPSQILLAHIGKEKVKLNLTLDSYRKKDDFNKLDKMISRLFEVQRLGRIGNYKQALISLDEIDSSYNRLSILHEMRGSIYYFKKDYHHSLGSFRKSFDLNPDNADAYYFKLQLESMLGVQKLEGKK